MKTETLNTPFMKTWVEYQLNSWTVCPLPLGMKATPPAGATGPDGTPMSDDAMMKAMSKDKWVDGELRPMGNIALVLQEGFIGIDVDDYATYEALCERLGVLPLEIVLTSHESLTEGFTAYFKVPKGKKWRSGIYLAGDDLRDGLTAHQKKEGFKGIDVIRHGHRYSVAPPSIHPSGRVYRWMDEQGRTLPFIPEMDDCPALPKKWEEFLTRKETIKEASEAVRRTVAQNNPNAVEASALSTGTACRTLNTMVNDRAELLRNHRSRSRHDTMVIDVKALVKAGANGHRGAADALESYRKAWFATFTREEFTGPRGRGMAAEFIRAVEGAQALYDGSKAVPCRCYGGSTPRAQKPAQRRPGAIVGSRLFR